MSVKVKLRPNQYHSGVDYIYREEHEKNGSGFPSPFETPASMASYPKYRVWLVERGFTPPPFIEWEVQRTSAETGGAHSPQRYRLIALPDMKRQHNETLTQWRRRRKAAYYALFRSKRERRRHRLEHRNNVLRWGMMRDQGVPLTEFAGLAYYAELYALNPGSSIRHWHLSSDVLNKLKSHVDVLPVGFVLEDIINPIIETGRNKLRLGDGPLQKLDAGAIDPNAATRITLKERLAGIAPENMTFMNKYAARVEYELVNLFRKIKWKYRRQSLDLTVSVRAERGVSVTGGDRLKPYYQRRRETSVQINVGLHWLSRVFNRGPDFALKFGPRTLILDYSATTNSYIVLLQKPGRYGMELVRGRCDENGELMITASLSKIDT